MGFGNYFRNCEKLSRTRHPELTLPYSSSGPMLTRFTISVA